MRVKLSLTAICAVALSGCRRRRTIRTATTWTRSRTSRERSRNYTLVVPHSWVYLEVKDEKGEPQIWALEATGRGGLERIGVTRQYIKAGDEVKARCHPLRDGSAGCLSRVLEGRRWNRQRLGRRQRTCAGRFLGPGLPGSCADAESWPKPPSASCVPLHQRLRPSGSGVDVGRRSSFESADESPPFTAANHGDTTRPRTTS